MTIQTGVSLSQYPFEVPNLDTLLRFAEMAEELGFETVWVPDHILMHTPVLDPIILLGAFMARTRRVRLGTGITLLALRNAAVLAKAISTLDYLCGGRVTIGVGVGGEYAKEFETVGIPLAERGRRVDEGIEVLRRLWSDDAASFEGRFYRFSDANMQPKPAQPGGPPIWIGGRSDAALRRVGRLGNAWLAYFVTPDRIRESRPKIEAAAREAGRDPARIGTAVVVYVVLSDDEAAARQQAAAHLGASYNQPFDERLVARYVAAGTPERCVSLVAGLVDAGARTIGFQPVVHPRDLLAQVERLGRDVLPAVRRLAE